MEIEQNQRAVLAHWTYNSEEWNSFIGWNKLGWGRLNYIFYYLFGKKETTIPEITITRQKIWINDAVESFSDIDRYVKRVAITDAGKFNLLEITYSILVGGKNVSDEIRIPVPKGKLKEAIQLQEKLIQAAHG